MTGDPHRQVRAVERVEAALEEHGCRRSGRMWSCPSHEDRTPSLSVDEGERAVVVHCFAGCDTADVVAAIGLPMSALFDGARPAHWTPACRRRAKPHRGRLGLPTHDDLFWAQDEEVIAAHFAALAPDLLTRAEALIVDLGSWKGSA
jgi:hypothetical protein